MHDLNFEHKIWVQICIKSVDLIQQVYSNAVGGGIDHFVGWQSSSKRKEEEYTA